MPVIAARAVLTGQDKVPAKEKEMVKAMEPAKEWDKELATELVGVLMRSVHATRMR